MAGTSHVGAALAAVCGIAAAVTLAGSALGGAAGAGGDRVVVCESGTVSSGGIDTSSAVAQRVPAGAPLPPGCRES